MALNNVSSLCRICLRTGATVPIFFKNERPPDTSITGKMSECFGEKIENIAGLPEKICELCNSTLDNAYNFLKRYRETCKILKINCKVVIKLEPPDKCANDQSSVDPFEIFGKNKEITIKKVKEEILDDFWAGTEWDLGAQDDTEDHVTNDNKQNNRKQKTKIDEKPNKAKTANNKNKVAIAIFKSKTKNKSKTSISKKKIVASIRESEKKKYKPPNSNTKIVASILEGDFTWSWGKWRENKPAPKKPQTDDKETEKNKNVIVETQPKKPKEYLCDHCGKVFYRKEYLSNHIKTITMKPDAYSCPKCPKKFKRKIYAEEHYIRVHEPESKTFLCQVCGRAFASLKCVNNHYRAVHDEEYKKRKKSKDFPCGICEKTFKSFCGAQIHRRSNHTGERPCQCKVCDARFFHESYLKQHMLLHTGETPHKCPICLRGYAQRGNMLSHVKHNHKMSQCDEALLATLKPCVLKAMRP